MRMICPVFRNKTNTCYSLTTSQTKTNRHETVPAYVTNFRVLVRLELNLLLNLNTRWLGCCGVKVARVLKAWLSVQHTHDIEVFGGAQVRLSPPSPATSGNTAASHE